MSDNTIFQSPFSARYASKEMQHLFSNEKKIPDLEKALDCIS